MKPLILTDYGLCLKTRDRKLVLVNQDSGARKEWLPVDFPFDSILVENLGGFVTFPALRWLATNAVTLTALDFNGQVLACFLPDRPSNPHASIAQIAAYLDLSSRFEIARFVLESKLGREVPTSLVTWDDLLTYEAREAARFYGDLGITRDYPNARDPTNACLNYAFGLLASRSRLAVHRLSLDPGVGFLHAPQNYKSALVYDVMEPFRELTVKTALSVREGLNSRDYAEVFGHGLKLRPEGAHRMVSVFARAYPETEMERFMSRLTLRMKVASDRTLAPLAPGREERSSPARRTLGCRAGPRAASSTG
jgi:CRISPR/Cas system-associated endonuclease Cas1